MTERPFTCQIQRLVGAGESKGTQSLGWFGLSLSLAVTDSCILRYFPLYPFWVRVYVALST